MNGVFNKNIIVELNEMIYRSRGTFFGAEKFENFAATCVRFN